MELTFGEQIKILLNRENMTIKDFAELLEKNTGVRCSRQNLTQKLKRDNFQEQDMRTLAAVLGYRVSISLAPASQEEIAEELSVLLPSQSPEAIPDVIHTAGDTELSTQDLMIHQTAEGLKAALQIKAVKKPRTRKKPSPALTLPPDCINPFTNDEYLTNTVRKHPELEHYIQVYDQTEHAWTDVAEDYFLKFQEQKRQLMGKDYTQPIYI